MKRILAAILSLIIILSLAACQPTPQQGVVAEKDSERMLENAQKATADASSGKSLSEQYGIPESYQFEAQGADGKLNITVDAQVAVPDGSAMPIYRVKTAEFSQDTVYAFFEALCGDTEMWIHTEQRTKDEIQEQILRLKKHIMENDQYIVDLGGIEEAEKILADLERQLDAAPETVVEERTYGELVEMSDIPANNTDNAVAGEGGADVEPVETPSPSTTYTGLNAYEKYDAGLNGEGRIFQVANNSTPSMHYFDHRNSAAGINFGSSSSLPILDDADIDAEILTKIGLTPSEARQMVQDLLDKTGSGMVVDSIYLQDDEQKGNYGEAARPAERYAYAVYCVRTVNGVPCSYVTGGSKPDANDMMAPYWHYESLYFMINSEGIIMMEWLTPIKVIETVNEDAQLKPFSEIQEIFEKMMTIKYEPQAEFGGNKYDFGINRIALSLHRIVEKNSNESGLLVPAWNFYGKLTVTPPGENPSGQVDYLGESFLTINAIDGSIIDVSKGY